MLPSFVFNDETKKNSHGFYLVNAGGKFERFRDNPVMLDHHVLEKLIGRWKNLRIEGSLLLADPEFDEGVALGAERKGQVERGFLKGASPGILPLKAEYRENPATGECDLYVTEYELMESSMASVPSNAGAVNLKVYDSNERQVDDKDIMAHLDNIVKLSIADAKPSKTNIKKMDKITLTAAAMVALGVKEDADQTAVSTAIEKLHKEKTDLAAEVEGLKDAEKERIKLTATAKVDADIKAGKVTAEKRDDLINLVIDKPELYDSLVGGQQGKVSLAGAVKEISGASAIPADRAGWTLLKWMKDDPTGLAKIKKEDPDVYEKIKEVRNK
jgi:hypothetical protein